MFRSMYQRNWSAGLPLERWFEAPSAPGLYVIGKLADETGPIGSPIDSEGKMGGFPTNFLPLYIGSSKSVLTGIRSRLYRHAKGRGNRYVAADIRVGAELHVSFIEGLDSAGYEALYLHIQTGFRFPYNRRSELTRYLKNIAQAIAEIGYSPHADPFAAWELGQTMVN